jgi:hypothetical protein
MDTARIELKPSSLVRIVAIGGDLRLTGADSQRLEAQAGRRGGLRVSTKGDGVELTCDGGCLPPAGCRVEIGVAGDDRVTDGRSEGRFGGGDCACGGWAPSPRSVNGDQAQRIGASCRPSPSAMPSGSWRRAPAFDRGRSTLDGLEQPGERRSATP